MIIIISAARNDVFAWEEDLVFGTHRINALPRVRSAVFGLQ